ncbi:MAG: septum formation inhibitor Maf [Hamadaea sp.]|uniref:Maf family protein n=1 Tax=Hamadaea sp. NPDC050747 TaxID=3155789 RepID=UPI00179227BD|nr:septum formation inhibitor Maf [Hamadaea sp.]NUR48226.1 septum formation inhibitor Maf [Hamadaea sp.]NUT04669.1 septum formation inhibitor Maf [Hamadaea sp.]
MNLVLASASPARLTLLTAAGMDPYVVVSGVDEEAVEATSAETLCATLARLKANAVAARIRSGELGDGLPAGQTLVLGCDSLLAFDDEILGKPDGPEEARKRWQAMRGRNGVLHTGHCLIDLAGGRAVEEVASTVVHFADISDAELDAYVDSGEPLGVAGAFKMDGLGGPFVERIEGDPSTIIGLSLPVLRHLLGRLDLTVMSLWRRS